MSFAYLSFPLLSWGCSSVGVGNRLCRIWMTVRLPWHRLRVVWACWVRIQVLSVYLSGDALLGGIANRRMEWQVGVNRCEDR